MEGKLVKNAEGCLEVELGPDGKPKYRGSGRDLTYRDEVHERKVHAACDRTLGGCRPGALAFLCEAYHEDTAPDEKGEMQTRVVMKFHPRIAPIKAAVFPAREERRHARGCPGNLPRLKKKFPAFYDEKGAVGRRYRRQDEAGTPYCITVDGQTLTDNTVTIRDRDTLEQWRVKVDDVVEEITQRVS